jgi:plasmid stabilization system protein ParE
MAYEIVWTKKARETTEKVVDYLENNWSAKVADYFIDNIHFHLSMLASGSLKGRPLKTNSKIKSVLITKHNRLYYRERKNSIQLLLLWDTRQNPKKHPFE